MYILIGILNRAGFFPYVFYLLLVSLTWLKRKEIGHLTKFSLCSFLYVLAIPIYLSCHLPFLLFFFTLLSKDFSQRLIVIAKSLGLSEGFLGPSKNAALVRNFAVEWFIILSIFFRK